MKKTELKVLIKECVREVLFEENVLSSVIAEVAYGITKAQSMMVEQIQENSHNNKTDAQPENTVSKKLQETRRKMLDAIGKDSMMGAFDGTEPLPPQNTPTVPSAPSGPLSHMAPGDPGVNIDGLFHSVGNSWQKLKG